MLKCIDPSTTQSWKTLITHFKSMKQIHMRTLFDEDLNRFDRFSIRFKDILVDYSKNIITEETLTRLIHLANECQLPDAMEKMFTGDKINANRTAGSSSHRFEKYEKGSHRGGWRGYHAQNHAHIKQNGALLQ